MAKENGSNGTMRVEVVTITTADAVKLLEKNGANRNINQDRVRQYAHDMKTGRWVLNGEPIQIDTNGEIANGQHRLWACVESGAPFETLIVTGLDPDAITTIDSGKPRSPGDMLNIAGHRNANCLAAIARTLVFYEREGVPYKKGTNPTKWQIMDIVNSRKWGTMAAEWASKATNFSKANLPMPTMLASLLCVFDSKHPRKAKAFYEGLVTGARLDPDSPILVLRNRLLKDKSENPHQRLSRRAVCGIVVHAWNAWVDNRRIKILRYSSEVAFPSIK